MRKLPDGTYVGADTINRYFNGQATESDVKQIKQLGSSINEENMNGVLKRMDDIANVKMGKETYGEMNKKTAGMSAYDKISYFSDVMSSPEFKAHTEELMKTAREVKNKSAEQAAVEEIRNKTINKLAEKSGYGIENHDLGEGINGYIDKANNKIIVNNNSKASPILTMVHELAHGSENDSTYKDTVKQAETYLAQKGTDIDQYKQKIKEAYAKKAIELTQDGLNQEMVSKFLEENVYKSEADVMDMAFKNPSLAQKIYDGISNTVNKIGAGKATKALINAKANFEKALNNLPNTKTAEGSLQYKVSDENDDVRKGIDTDNSLEENNQVDDASHVNSDGSYSNDADNSSQGIANGDGIEYKGEEGIINNNNIPALNKRTDYYKYVRDIANETDISLDGKVRHIQDAFNLLKNKKDVICPSDSKFVERITDDGDIRYKWSSKLGFVPESIKAITRENSLPTDWHRFGSLSGSNFTIIQEGMEQYSTSELGLPYIENNHARHDGTFNNDDYFNIIDAIRNGDIEAFNATRQKQGLELFDSKKLNYYQKKYNDYIKKVKVEIGDINAPYGLYGYVNPLEINGKIELKGGAEQYTTPFTGKLLEKLGLLNITK